MYQVLNCLGYEHDLRLVALAGAICLLHAEQYGRPLIEDLDMPGLIGDDDAIGAVSHHKRDQRLVASTETY